MSRIIECPAGHKITATIDYKSGMYLAECECGWHTASVSAGLRNWNVDGHLKDVEEARA